MRLDDPQRLAAIDRHDLATPEQQPTLDRAARVASQLMGTPVSLVSVVTADRQMFPGQVGLTGHWGEQRHTPLSHSFCQHVVTSELPLVVDDATRDPLLRDNLAIPDLGVIAYLGVPMRDGDGNVLGAFCVIDGAARGWSDDDLEAMQDLVAMVETEFALRHRTAALEEAATAADDALTVLVHDVRSPLTRIAGSLSTLDRLGVAGDQGGELVAIAHRAVDQLTEMADRLLVASRAGRTTATEPVDVRDVLDALARDETSTHRGQLRLDLPDTPTLAVVHPGALLQIVQNLVDNARTHGGADATISLRAGVGPAGPWVEVADDGPGMGATTLSALQSRDGSVEQRFGWRIVHRLARDIGAQVSIDSGDEGTTIRIVLPTA